VQLVVVLVRLELGDLLLPVCVENVAVVARQALVDLCSVSVRPIELSAEGAYVLPRGCKQLGIRRMALGGNLDQTSAADRRHTEAQVRVRARKRDVRKQRRLGREVSRVPCYGL
jgi:hypothetical protein